MIKFAKIIWKIEKAWLYAICAVKKGHDKKDLCSGVIGGDRCAYKCSDCPYFKNNKKKNKEKTS